MEFVKEFAIFLHKNNIIKFGDFTLTSGKNSSYYIDLRLVPSYRNKPKEHGTTKSIEGKTSAGMKVVMVDDVATTGTSVLNGIKQLKESGLLISDVYVIINRLEGADKALDDMGVQIHQLTDILEITNALFQEKLVSKEIFDKIKNQVNQN